VLTLLLMLLILLLLLYVLLLLLLFLLLLFLLFLLLLLLLLFLVFLFLLLLPFSGNPAAALPLLTSPSCPTCKVKFYRNGPKSFSSSIPCSTWSISGFFRFSAKFPRF
jgi:hypothetical protein